MRQTCCTLVVRLLPAYTQLQMHMSHTVAGDNDGLQNWRDVTAAYVHQEHHS